jgi:CheY-like chemotaxis protein
MSHELRTPLNAILGFAQLMTRGQNLTLTQRENLETIGRSGEHLLGLINDVLELSKIEAGRVELQPENFDLHRMLLGLGEMFSLRAEAKDLTLVFDLDPDVAQYVRADQSKLRQVLINLMGNAVKFTHKGSITLRVKRVSQSTSLSPVDSAQPQVDVQPQADVRLLFEVKDTGVGIAPDELDQVFGAFVQTASGRQTHRGTGLGIPISREFVRMMGGDLILNSEVGKSTCFQFDVPVEIVDADQVQTAQPTRRVVGFEPGQRAADGGPYRLLVAEDIAPSRKLLVKLLQSLADPSDNQGFEVREAVNGQEAIEIWEEWKPHLIWMDMRMPIIDGREATRRIKATSEGQNTVIVALTASAFQEDRTEALATGCDDFVRKPFREADIFDTLTRHLGVRFVYEEIGESSSQRGSELVEEAEEALTLEKMPVEWRAEMRQATLEGDLDWMTTLVAQISDQHVALAGRLTKLVDGFEHDEILYLIAQAHETMGGGT